MPEDPRWLTIDLPVRRQPTLEIRAEPNEHGSWRIRGERSVGREGVILFGYLEASAQRYAISVDRTVDP